jgi:predicted nucleotidyltransferase
MEKTIYDPLCWIVNLLKNNNIQFIITGGLAAIYYGSDRDLYDIDIDIYQKDINKLSALLDNYIGPHNYIGPQRYVDKHWNIYLLTLKYKKQLIDISCVDDAQIFNSIINNWQYIKTDISSYNEVELFGINVPIINKEELIEYKMMLGRSEDIYDIGKILHNYSYLWYNLDILLW